MEARDVVEQLARGRVVEQMVENIARSSLTPDLQDLCQMVYVILLEYDPATIMDLHASGDLPFFVARIILNQYRSKNSPFYYQIRRFLAQSREITHRDENRPADSSQL